MRVNPRSHILVGALAVTLMTSACGAPATQEELDVGSLEAAIPLEGEFDPQAEFTWSTSDGTTSWDPVQSATAHDVPFLTPIYDRLVYAAPDGTLEPMLAESWEASADGSMITFKLREGLTFSDGTPFNAEAVKVNIERAMGPESLLKSDLAGVTGVEVVDEMTVNLAVDGALGVALAQMSGRAGMMASPQAIAAGTLATEPVGIGPYTASEILPGESVTLKRTPNYWDPDAQRVATMFFREVPDDQTRLNGLISGEYDGAVIRPNQVDVAQSEGLNVVSDASRLLSYIALNTGIEPLGDPKVRQALNHAINREGISNGLWEGFCTPQIQPFPEGSFAYSETVGSGLDELGYDPEKAKKLLAEAGYPDGFTLDIVAGDVSINQKTAEVIQSQLEEIGVTANIEVLPTAPLIEAFVINKTAGALVATSGPAADPHAVLQSYVLPDARVNPGGTLPEEMTDLAAKAAAPLDGADRSPFYGDFMELWMETPPSLLSLCMINSLQAFSPEVMGVNAYESGVYDLRGVAIEEE